MGNEVKLYSSGALVSSATIMTGEILSSGGNNSMFIFKGGIAEDTAIFSGTSADVSEGGIASGVTVYSEGGIRVLSGGTANDVLLLKNGTVFVHGGVASNVVNLGTTTRYGGDVNIASGGSVYHVSVSGTGDIYIFSSGYAEDIHVYAGGHLNVGNDNWSHLTQERWGSACSAYISSGGELHVGPGGQVTQATILSGGRGWVSSGGIISGATLAEGHSNDMVIIKAGGSAVDTNVFNGGDLVVYGTASNTVLSGNIGGDYSDLLVRNFGCAYNTEIFSGGGFDVSSGGIASKVILHSNGQIIVRGGAEISNISADGGNIYIYGKAIDLTGIVRELRIDGGFVSSTVVSGYMGVYGNGSAADITINSGELTVENGSASDVTLNGGSLTIGPNASNGIVSNAIVNGGIVTIRRGMTNTTSVNSGGSMFISSGCTASAIKENGGFVDIASGAITDFVKHSFGGLVLMNSAK